MKNNLKHINDLVNRHGIIYLDDFYTSTFTNWEVSFQGKMTAEKIATYGKFFTFIPNESGFLEACETIDGVKVRITLT
jgi:hypothetical protein